jgi:hypothetical protein
LIGIDPALSGSRLTQVRTLRVAPRALEETLQQHFLAVAKAVPLEVQVVDRECGHDFSRLSWFARVSSIIFSASVSICGVGNKRVRNSSSKMRIFQCER